MTELEKFFDDLEKEGIIEKVVYIFFKGFESFLAMDEDMRQKFIREMKKFAINSQKEEALDKIIMQRMNLAFRMDNFSLLFEYAKFGIIIKETEREIGPNIDEEKIAIAKKIYILILDQILGVQKRAV